MSKAKVCILAAVITYVPLGLADDVTSQIIPGVKLTGTKLATIPMLTLGDKQNFPVICQAMCIAEEECVGFTMQNNFCHLKSEVSARDFKSGKGAHSGVVRGD